VKIAVSGAAGQLGRLVVTALLERVPPADVIAITRSPSDLETFDARGVAVRQGDFCEPDALVGAFADAERALIISTVAEDPVRLHLAAFAAAAKAGVRHLYYTSVLNPIPENPFPAAQTHHVCEQALRNTAGIEWTILRNALYGDLRADLARVYCERREWITNVGSGVHAFVSRADCAAAAAAALTTDGHENAVYEITGPQEISAWYFTDLLREFSREAVACKHVDDDYYERYRAAFARDPANATYLELFTGTGKAIREGFLRGATDDVAALTGHTPHALRQLFERRFAAR
jgi:NAD(P)H dehydrogenase (quinone)